ncbi:MAG: stage V sporulation protein S [Patescibacteria group bacterium]|jgi:stage V sporulation protein S
MLQDNTKTFRVAGKSKATEVAGAIAWRVREVGKAKLLAVGPAAVNQATKAVAIARTYLALEGVELVMVPEFVDVDFGDKKATGLEIIVEKRQ